MNAIKGDLGRAAFSFGQACLQASASDNADAGSARLPAAVVGVAGDVMAMNDLMEALAPRLTTLARNRLHFSGPSGQCGFCDGTGAASSGKRSALPVLSGGRTAGCAGPCRACRAGQAPCAGHLHPQQRGCRRHAVGEVGPPDLKVICGLFDLTRAEARVAQEITIGRSVEEVAASMGTTVATVRTQLKSVYRKTGVNRQSQLVALLSGIRPITRT